MSFEEGRPITDLKYLQENNISLTYLATLMAHIINKQIFEFGFVHADPHGGNVFVRKENNEVKIILLDHGIYRQLDDEFRINYANFWKGIITQDKDLIKTTCLKLNVTNENIELFLNIITSKSYKEIMNKDNKFDSNRKIGQISKII